MSQTPTSNPNPSQHSVATHLLSLPKPDKLYLGQTIEATLDDLVALIEADRRAYAEWLISDAEGIYNFFAGVGFGQPYYEEIMEWKNKHLDELRAELRTKAGLEKS